MKKISKLPTILGLVILIFGVIAGVVLINSQQVFKIGADTEAIPKNVRVSNLTDSSATVTWTTDIESSGFIKWGETPSLLNKTVLDDSNNKSLVHSVNISGISPSSQIYFKINSNSKDYDNNKTPWSLTTLATKQESQNSLIASGTILKTNASTPARAIVYLTINGTVVSALSSDEGNYLIPLSNYFANISDTTAVEISVQGGSGNTTQAVIYPRSIKFIPTMILGRSYDFRTAVENNSNQLPESTLSVPESVEVSSRFEVAKTEKPNEEVKGISIDSIDEGEIITTTDPEFFGTGPANEQIEIQIESELQTAIIEADSKGTWKWSPPNNLEPGEHKVTLKWKDTSGIIRILTRTFIVSAAEGPAFESTSSATLAPSPSATATPASAGTTSATLKPTPETGSLTPTLGLFIMGMGLLFGSVFIFKQHA